MLMNGFNEETHNAFINSARELVDIFEEYSEDGICSEEGLELMGDLFGEIKEEFRGDVFEHLLFELEDRGIDYDLEQFKAEE